MEAELAKKLQSEDGFCGIESTAGTGIKYRVVGEARSILHGAEDGLGVAKDTVHITVCRRGYHSNRYARWWEWCRTRADLYMIAMNKNMSEVLWYWLRIATFASNWQTENINMEWEFKGIWKPLRISVLKNLMNWLMLGYLLSTRSSLELYPLCKIVEGVYRRLLAQTQNWLHKLGDEWQQPMTQDGAQRDSKPIFGTASWTAIKIPGNWNLSWMFAEADAVAIKHELARVRTFWE